MLPKRLTLAAFAALFAASSSIAMLQSARPALADQDDHWRRNAHHQRHDRDDRRNNGSTYRYNGYNNGWNNGQVYTTYPNNGTYWNGNGYTYTNYNNNGWNNNGNWHRRHVDRDGRKPHHDAWRDHR